MSKLHFRYGVMGSAKTLMMLAVAHSYRRQGKSVLLMKPSIDDRAGGRTIASRAGLSAEADIVLKPSDRIDMDLLMALHPDISCILVDEAQFLTPQQVEDLRLLSVMEHVPVICYGLRTDFMLRLFPGSQRLLEIADVIEEVKMTCEQCEDDAICNMRVSQGRGVFDGPSVMVGGDDTYMPVCWYHWHTEFMRSKGDV